MKSLRDILSEGDVTNMPRKPKDLPAKRYVTSNDNGNGIRPMIDAPAINAKKTRVIGLGKRNPFRGNKAD